ncbi:MAG: T9SS type A sorting domain-containing protein [Chlorobi bacterium]|nr:T9SS type A sorting domain-containing protein [Chlorobiota bacterium]
MKNRNLKLIILIILIFGTAELKSQNYVPVSGGESTGSGGTVSYTVGQLFYNTIISSDGVVNEGVQQPVEMFVSTGDAKPEITLNISVFPNPANEFLILKVESNRINDMYYRLFDIKGTLLKTKKITNTETTINISMLNPSVYFLKVLHDDGEEKIFKIIKH